jgi:hypothetical protein
MRTRVTALLLGVGACIAAPVDAAGQLFVEARGGAAFPTGDLGRGVEAGAAFGAGAGVRITPRLAVRADVDAASYEGTTLSGGAIMPGVNHLHYVAGVEFVLVDGSVGRSPLVVTANAGAGGTRVEVETFVVPITRPQGGRTFKSSASYFTLNAGARASLALGPRVGVVGSVQGFRVAGDEEDTATLKLLSDDATPFGTTLTFPVTLGLRLTL